MFQVQRSEVGRFFPIAIGGLMILSAAALAITIWVMNEFLREQEIVRDLIEQLPRQAIPSAETLAGELRWQFRLSILVVLNLIATGVAVLLLWRAYTASQQSLDDIKVLAADVLSSMDQAVITTDLEGTITSINRRGKEILATDDGAVGRRLGELCEEMDLDAFRRQAKSDAYSFVASDYRDYVVKHGGGNRTLRAFCQTLRDRSDRQLGSVLQLRDVTLRTQMEEQVRRMEKFMGLGSLTAGLHHEIKNPLSALSLHVQLLDEHCDGKHADPETREIVDVLKTEVSRIAGVLEGFRDYSSIDRLTLTSVDVQPLLEAMLKLIAPQATAAGIEVDFQCEAALPTTQADRARLEQVLLNLLINAIEAMPDGGRLVVSAFTREDRLVIQVIDNGGGIPQNLQRRIFDPYFTTKTNGTGMGLALCEKIVRQHDGLLDLFSSSTGSVFTISLAAE